MKYENSIKLPRSFSDWTWTTKPEGSLYDIFQLDPARYVSAPSSVLSDIAHLTETMYGIALCNLIPTLNLKEGRIITHIWRYTDTDEARALIIFGAQGDVNDTFFYKKIEVMASTWKKVRFSWWDSFDLTNIPKLATRMDYWNGDDWELGVIDYINRLTGDINKCGIGQKADALYRPRDWWDDTEIWI